MKEEIDVVVVSLFDGLSGGRIALDRTPHLNVLRYYSSEIDKYAIQIADKNYQQDTEFRLGNVTKIDTLKLKEEIKSKFPNAKIMLIGGSPCQGFSMAGKLKGSSTKCGKDVTTLEQYLVLKDMGFEFDGQSYLFWEYIRIKKELNPNYFMLENVRVTKKWKPMFDEAMGVEPIFINSLLLSVQSRPRYYWTNIQGIVEPTDLNLSIQSILDPSLPTMTLCGASRGRYIVDGKRQDGIMKTAGLTTQMLEVRSDNKMNCITTVKKDNILVNNIPKGSRVVYADNRDNCRNFSMLEYERGQTLPDNYTLILKNGKQTVSDNQRLKMIGNGWTINVISFIFGHIK